MTRSTVLASASKHASGKSRNRAIAAADGVLA
jgi:hypothetical protein